MTDAPDNSLLWLVILAFIVAFIVAFGIGANDVANSFGTTVGAKVLGLFQACILASIFELSGAVLIGARVSDTVREGIVDSSSFNGTENLVMAGAFSALSGTSCWLIAATFLSLPVSATHAIVGATMGYALVEYGTDGVQWKKMWMIAASWVISPVLSGAVSSLFFLVIKLTVLSKEDSFEAGLRSIAVFYGLTVAVNFFSVFYRGSQLLGFSKIPLYAVLILSLGGALLVALVIHFAVRPWLKKKILRQVANREGGIIPPTKDAAFYWKIIKQKLWRTKDSNREETELCRLSVTGSVAVTVISDSTADNDVSSRASIVQSRETPIESETVPLNEHENNLLTEDITDTRTNDRSPVSEDFKTGQLFAFLQILMASFGAFAHGGNDVSNAIGPLTSLWGIHKSHVIVSPVQTPFWMLLFGGLGIVIGLCVWGRKVIKTMGEDLTPITPSSGFTIEIGSALTVLVASNLGIPISTTHCKVGSVVSIGWLRSRKVVDWKLFGNIVLSWIVTVPCSGGMAAAVYAAVRQLVY